MSIILTCGHKYSGYESAHQILLKAGLGSALPSNQAKFTPEEIGQGICKAYNIEDNNPAHIQQLEPSKLWQNLTTDLLLTNLKQNDWGWSDSNLIYVLDHWAEYDPSIKFVLTYCSPGEAIARMKMINGQSAADHDKTLAMWQAVNSGILKFYHQHRDRCILVNSSLVRKDAGFFVNYVKDQLKVDLSEIDNTEVSSEEGLPIPALVASLQMEDGDDHSLLFQEMESSTNFPTELTNLPQSELMEGAWQQYKSLIDDRNELSTVKSKLEAVEAKNTLLEQQLNEVQEELELYFVNNKKLEDKNQSLKTKLDESQVRLEQMDKINAKLIAAEKKNSELQAKIAQNAVLQQKLDQAQSKNKKLTNETASLQSDLKKAKATGAASGQQKELSQENELLLGQLHQVQEELEHYFLKYQSLTKDQKTSSNGLNGAANTVAKPGAKQAVIDLRHFVDGNNWWDAEDDGRWAGPSNTSNLLLPKLEAGRYRLDLDVVDAMAPEILRGMTLTVNEKPLPWKGLKLTGKPSSYIGLSKKKVKYPQHLFGTFTVSEVDAREQLKLAFHFPKVLAPSEKNASDEDMRPLTVRFQQVRINRI